jgi:hypothetical protein
MKYLFFTLLISFFLTSCSNQEKSQNNKNNSGAVLDTVDSGPDIEDDSGPDIEDDFGDAKINQNDDFGDARLEISTKLRSECLWCGRHIDFSKNRKIILYNPFLNTVIIPNKILEDIQRSGGRAPYGGPITRGYFTGKDAKYRRFRTDVFCSIKCYNELKSIYFREEQDDAIFQKRKDGLTDYYFFFK